MIVRRAGSALRRWSPSVCVRRNRAPISGREVLVVRSEGNFVIGHRSYATRKHKGEEVEAQEFEEQERELEDEYAEVNVKEPSRIMSKATINTIEKLKRAVVPDPTQPIPHLPARDVWPSTFLKTPGLRKHRWFIANPDTCQSVVKALGLDRTPKAGMPKTTVIEGYAGPGVMTRAFLNARGVEKVVAIEQDPVSQKALQYLQEESSVANKREKLSIIPRTAFDWSSYEEMLNCGSLDHLPQVSEARKIPPDFPSAGYFTDETWLQPSPLLFFAQLPSTVHSEQLLSQLLRAISHRLWLWRFGRLRLALMCSEQIAERMQAPLGSRLRGKFTTIAEATCKVTVLKPPEDFIPSKEHFFPPTLGVGSTLPSTTMPSSIKSKRKMVVDLSTREHQCLVLIEPLVKPLVKGDELDTFDYVTKNLFVLRSTPIRTAMSHLAAGAENILRRLDGEQTHPALADIGGAVYVDPKTRVMDLTVEQIVAITRIFDRWPFRPQHLFDEGSLEEVMKKKNSDL